MLVAAISADAAGYLRKSADGIGLLAAIHAIARGESVIDPAHLPPVLEVPDEMQDHGPLSGLASLTPAELRILTLLTEGLTNREIGVQVALSESTVKRYVTRVLAKLGVEHRSQTAVLASKLLRSSPVSAVAGETASPG